MLLFVQWSEYFHSVKDKMFYSTTRYENILTIALINMNYLYTNECEQLYEVPSLLAFMAFHDV